MARYDVLLPEFALKYAEHLRGQVIDGVLNVPHQISAERIIITAILRTLTEHQRERIDAVCVDLLERAKKCPRY